MAGHSKSRTRRIIACTWLIPIIVCLPFVKTHSLAISRYSHLGTIERQICQDSFDDIDNIFNYSRGSFRHVYFIVLFVVVYLVPLLTILVTCVRIAICLLHPSRRHRADSKYSRRMTRRRDESKRRVGKPIPNTIELRQYMSCNIWCA